jgi:hypothetical protein
MSNIKLARSLGWTSLAIGAVEIAATRWLENEMGVGDHHTLIRSFGIREIAAGFTILSQPGMNQTLANGLWARVAGDAVDLAMLGIAAPSTRRPSGLIAIAASVLAVTGLDIFVATRIQADIHHASSVATAARERVAAISATTAAVTTVPQSIVAEDHHAFQT